MNYSITADTWNINSEGYDQYTSQLESATARIGGYWYFQDGDLTLPAEGDILRSDGTSFVRDLKVEDSDANYQADYYISDSDRGKLLYRPGNYVTYIPNPNNLRLPVGSTITIVNAGGNGDLYIQVVDSDYSDLYGAGTDTNYYRWTLPSNSIATLIKVYEEQDGDWYDKWLLSGVGIAADT